MPTVSVIVTTYNRPKLLKETIDSILNQTFQDFELIIVDNCSNYDFFALVEGVGNPKIRPYQNQNKGVIAVNRNFAIEKATGQYLAFCDDDDIWMYQKLEKQMGYVKEKKLHGKKIVLYSNATEFKENGSSSNTKKKKTNSINDLLKSNQVSFSTSFVSNNFDNIRFNELPEFFGVEDYIFWMELNIADFSYHLQVENFIRYRVLKSSSSAINYGLNHVRTIIALMFVAIKYRNTKKINYFVFSKSAVNQIVKFWVKKIIKSKK